MVVEESLVSDDWEKVVNYIRKRVVMVEQMDRSQLVELVRTVLRMRNCLVERERNEGVATMFEMGRATIN